MSFKQFGGLNYSAKNNIVGNLYANSTNSGTANIIGQENSKITSQSHLDMSANSVMHIGSLYFMDGTIQSTAYANSSGTKSTFNYGIVVNNGSTLNGGATVSGGLTADTLTVTKQLSLLGSLAALNGLTVSINNLPVLTVSSSGTAIQGNLSVTGTATINKLIITELSITNNFSVNGTSSIGILNASGLITANAGLTSTLGATTLGTTTASNLTSTGLITGQSGLKITSGTTELLQTSTSTLTASGLITGGSGLKIISGTTELLQTSTSTLTASGLITGSSGLKITSGTTELLQTTTSTLTTSGLITASAGLTSTLGATTLGTTTATSLSVGSVSTMGTNTLTVNGTTQLNGATSITNGGLTVTASAGVIINGGDLAVEGSGKIYANSGYILSSYNSSSASPFNLLTDSISPFTPQYIKFGTTSGTITIPSTVASTTSTSGALVVNGGVGVQGDFYNINTPFSSTTRTTAYFDNLNVSGTLSFNNTTASKLIVQNLEVDGYATIASYLTVGGTVTITGDLTVNGNLNYQDLSVSGNLTVNGLTTLNNGLTVSSGSTILKTTSITTLSATTLNAYGVSTLYGDVIVGSAGTTTTMNVYGTLNINSQNLNFKQNSNGDTQSVQWYDTSGTYMGLIYPSKTKSALVIDIHPSLTNGFMVANAGTAVFAVSLTGSVTATTLTVSTINPPASTNLTIGNALTSGNNLILGNSTANSVTLSAQPTTGTDLAVATLKYVNDRTGSASTISTTNTNSITTLYPVMTTGASTGLTPYVDTTGISYDASNNILTVGSLTATSRMSVFNNSATQFSVDASGNATLGPSNGTSSTALTVNGGATITGSVTASKLALGGATLGTNALAITGTTTISSGNLTVNNGNLTIYDVNSTQMFSVTSGTGSTVIGQSGGLNGNLTVNGPTTIYSTCTAQSFTSGSDYRIKENIIQLNDSFNVDKLRPVTYTNKNTKKQDIGFIAHEVQEEFPYLVSGEKDGEQMQSLNYIGLIGVLVKEIQDLKKRVQMLENK